MRKRTPKTSSLHEQLRKTADPFWQKIANAGMSRFFVTRLMRSLLWRFRADRFARVRQGGLLTDKRAELSRVFVDLEAQEKTRGDETQPSENIVASWMKGKPKLPSHPEGMTLDEALAERAVPMDVVIGGPGQGKSTVCRFMMLIHASILLLTCPPELVGADLVPKTEASEMETLLQGLSKEGIPWPSVLRLPIWVELRQLAGKLLERDDDNEQSISEAFFRWLALENFKEADDADTLRDSLTQVPWVMIFDGLDEVPPERARSLVLACVDTVRSQDPDTVDGFVVGTSRPQSYGRDAFGWGVRERTLSPLSHRSALLYAQRFAASVNENEAEQKDLVEKLKNALTNEVTARLMSNPLLVTIMATIVMHNGKPSDRRWTLFESYYDTLYKRETQREHYLSGLLAEYKEVIDSMHAHVGLALQVRSEENDGVTALIPEQELRTLLTAHLQNYDEATVPGLVDNILRAAEQRLVFLVQAEEGQYGFELRSFQEFMAAKQLFRLPDVKLDSLLKRLAPLNGWRNVVLFLIGAHWANSSAFKEQRTVGLCKTLNEEGEPMWQAAKMGSRLASWILEDAPYGAATKPRDALKILAAQVSDDWAYRDDRSPEQKERDDTFGTATLLAMKDPTAANLAAVLELKDSTRWATHFNDLWSWGMWPLRYCNWAVENKHDKHTIAERLRHGDLGDKESWAKLRIRDGVSVVERMRRLALSPDSLRACLVDGDYVEEVGGADVHEAAQSLRECKTPWVRRMIAHAWLKGIGIHRYALGATPELPGRIDLDDLIEILNAAEELDLAIFDALHTALPVTQLPTVLERTKGHIRRSTKFLLRARLVPTLLEALRKQPDSERIHEALLVAYTHERLDKPISLEDAEPVGNTADALLLRFLARKETPDDFPRFATLLIQNFNARGIYHHLNLLEDHPDFLIIADHLLQHPTITPSKKNAVLDAIASHFASQPSSLSDPDAWTAAGLPPPPPMKPVPAMHHELLGARITSIKIENFRAFSQTFRCNVKPTNESGQWIVFLGENGTGKTSLLRAIAMALASPTDAAAIPSNLEAPLRRDESRPGFARIRTQDGRELVANVQTQGNAEAVLSAEVEQSRPFVVGYGCRRGSATSGEDYQNAFRPFRDLDNLFDKPFGLIRAAGWLKELQRRSKNNGTHSKHIYDAAREALKYALLDAESILVEDEVEVFFKNGRTVPLDRLSDGYLTTTGWIVDLMARWLKRNETRRDIDDNFPAMMEGVVLIDEIDLHLHPRWQEHVIEDVRKIFPKMTFVVTTHHGLTLRGARKGEIFVLGNHEGNGEVTAIQRDIPQGTRIDQLVTGQWFNRPSAIIDQDTRDKLDEHQRLILAGAPAGDPDRKAIEEELRQRLGHFADTSLERLAANIVAQHLKVHYPEPSAEKREEVRDEVLAILARRETKQTAKKKG